jgi:eukaryotic-like serine/threonine-protein kinase
MLGSVDPVTSPDNNNLTGGNSTTNQPNKPRITDHQVLRCIGRGSYGEVWLCRTVTGSLRAVKVVQRQDFESERTFEREFEGLLKIEPISRSHPGLVDILHVGRPDGEDFYYYVMELADDRERGSKINPVDYEPRTLNLERQSKKLSSVDDTINVGIALAGGLQHLHERGLTHRDIKPSNIIFVEGVPKLADIGLVAEAGQHTYVGTEGFVPPEGPGTALADIYGLGMVLYEMSTGKDRLSFPELADDAGLDKPDRKRARMLNELICKACHPNPSRRIPTARHLIEALRRVRLGKYNRPILPRAAGFFAISSLVGLSLSWAKTGQLPWPPGYQGKYLVDPGDSVRRMDPEPHPLPVVGDALLIINTEPPGATLQIDGRPLGFGGPTPQALPAKKEVTLTVSYSGYQTETIRLKLNPGENEARSFRLKHSPPSERETWTNSQNMTLRWNKKTSSHHSDPISPNIYRKLVQEDASDTAGGKAWVLPVDAQDFCKRLLENDERTGFLEPQKFYYSPNIQKVATAPEPSSKQNPQDLTQAEVPSRPPASKSPKPPEPAPFSVQLFAKQFGDLQILSEPPGATVSVNGKPLNPAPLTLKDQPIGSFTFTLTLTGYEDLVTKATVRANQVTTVKAELKPSKKAVLGRKHINSLGMNFVPIEGTDLSFSIYETRKRDYDAFVQDVGEPPYPNPFNTGLKHPVATTRTNAIRFCQWLTMKEREEGYLPADLEYRLPSDEEWSLAADQKERNDRYPDPSRRNRAYKGRYVWGDQEAWPPPREKGLMPGNFSDASRIAKDGIDAKYIVGANSESRYPDGKTYDDGYPYASPVGEFAPNKFGLYDLCGNVSEWVSTDYGGTDKRLRNYGVLRGGNWAEGGKEELLASCRNAVDADRPPDGLYGFRCVLAKASKEPPRARALEE